MKKIKQRGELINMENQLDRTDRVIYKIKRFFQCIFIKRNSLKTEKNKKEEVVDINVELEKVISCKTEAQEIDIKEQLSKKILKKEIAIKELSDEEIEEMIEYFKADIKIKSEELSNIKKQFAELKKNEKQ